MPVINHVAVWTPSLVTTEPEAGAPRAKLPLRSASNVPQGISPIVTPSRPDGSPGPQRLIASRLCHAGCAAPEEFERFTLPNKYGGMSILKEGVCPDHYQHLVDSGFFAQYPEARTLDDVLIYLHEQRDMLCRVIADGVSPHGLTRDKAYQSLLSLLIGEETNASLRYQQVQHGYAHEEPRSQLGYLESVEKLAGLALGLQECEAMFSALEQGGVAAAPAASVVMLLDSEMVNPINVRPQVDPVDCFFQPDLSAVIQAAKSVGAHYQGPPRDLPGRHVGTMPYWSVRGEEAGAITTTFNSGQAFRESSRYQNQIEPHQWTFAYNFRHGGAYASDVFACQYLAVAKAGDFLGVLPHTIRREDVTNKETNRLMSGFESGSPQALEAFLTRTANGKSTQRVMQLFGLEAISVTYPKKGKVDTPRDYDVRVRTGSGR